MNQADDVRRPAPDDRGDQGGRHEDACDDGAAPRDKADAGRDEKDREGQDRQEHAKQDPSCRCSGLPSSRWRC